MALEIRDEVIGDIRVIGLVGRLDTDTSSDLELAVQDLIDAGARDFLVDLAGVGYVSSAGLRVLLMIGKTVDGKGSLRLCGLNPTVRQVFDVAGFTQLFAIAANREAALVGIKAKEPRAVTGTASTESKSSPQTLAEPVAKLLGVKPRKAEAEKPDASLAAEVSRLLKFACAR